MPLGPYEDFDACVLAQIEKGHDEESAKKICGAIKAKVEDASQSIRYDAGTLGKPRRTPQGGLRVPANLTRTGVFVYRRADGTEQRELRPPDEVFHEDSLATLASAPVTDLHPPNLVETSNWKDLAAGHVIDKIERDGTMVRADLAIQDAELVRMVESRERREVSCGYAMTYDATPGVYKGERYDGVQRNIRYNHVALGPVGWGRAGREVALRLDTAMQVIETKEKKMATKYRIDGVDYDTSTDEFVQAVGREFERRDNAFSTVIGERDELQGKIDALSAENKKLKTRLDSATNPQAIADAVKARVTLETDAKAVLGDEVKLDSKSDRDIMVDVIRKDDVNFIADQRSDDYVRGRYESVVSVYRSADNGGTGIGAVREAAVQARKDAADKKDDNDPLRARERMLENNSKMAFQPLSFSRRSA